MLVQPITILTAIIAKSIYDQLTGKKEGGLLSPTSLLDIDEDTSSPLTEKNAQQLSMVDDMTFQKLKDEVLAKLPEVITKVLYTPSSSCFTETLDSLYLNQITSAQEFLNENPRADLSRVKCLLRKMLPKAYHEVIDKLKQHQDPKVIINIHGGHNLIAPDASEAKQNNH
jgi:hypothetical protein